MLDTATVIRRLKKLLNISSKHQYRSKKHFRLTLKQGVKIFRKSPIHKICLQLEKTSNEVTKLSQ